MDKVYLRHLFEENRLFLKQLSSGQNGNKILNNAPDNALDVVLRILFLIANGEIHLHENHQDIIKKSKRLRKLSAFESRQYLLQILQNSRSEKLIVLKQFLKLYPYLLHTFFHI
jgi:tRNA G37 N-methylase Trm5